MKEKRPKSARILALIGIILLLAMYGSTMVFALIKSPAARGLLMGSVFCTIAVPVLLYAIMLVAKNVRGKALPHNPPEGKGPSAEQEVPEKDSSGDGKEEALKNPEE